MTMRRTRRKLEPQCDQSCVQGTVQQTRTTQTTEKKHYRQSSSGHSRFFSCCSREFLHASGLRPHCTCCCACRSAFVSSLHLLSMFPHIHFSPVCEFLADFVDSHTAKTGLLRCCLYTPRRLQQTAVSCKRSICNKIENNKINSCKPFV